MMQTDYFGDELLANNFGIDNTEIENYVSAYLLPVVLYHCYAHDGFQIADLYKLVYQHFYGPGHIIENTEYARSNLLEELRSIKADSNVRLFEILTIENHFFRINLAPFKARRLDAKKLANAFIESANNKHLPSISVFKLSWNYLADYFEEACGYFKSSEMRDYLKTRETHNYAPSHHSFEYRELNNPSYRVLRRDAFLKYFPKFTGELMRINSIDVNYILWQICD